MSQNRLLGCVLVCVNSDSATYIYLTICLISGDEKVSVYFLFYLKLLLKLEVPDLLIACLQSVLAIQAIFVG